MTKSILRMLPFDVSRPLEAGQRVRVLVDDVKTVSAMGTEDGLSFVEFTDGTTVEWDASLPGVVPRYQVADMFALGDTALLKPRSGRAVRVMYMRVGGKEGWFNADGILQSSIVSKQQFIGYTPAPAPPKEES